MTTLLSAIICTHNPRRDYLSATLDSLRAQVPLPNGACWELILLDHASTSPIADVIDISWHSNARIIREERLGLTHARLRSFRESIGSIIVYIDDDNVLDPNYFWEAFSAMQANSNLGAAGGKSIPLFEVQPPVWFAELGIDLACRDLGDEAIYASWACCTPYNRTYPECAPIGAGMVIRREAYAAYVDAVTSSLLRINLGRKGNDLSSGEDNDMVMSLLAEGWDIAYLPQLSLRHLIPARRLTKAYLSRYAYSANRTWIQVLNLHGIRQWTPVSRWSLPLRRARAFFRNRAWASDANYVRWRGACGALEGRAALSELR